MFYLFNNNNYDNLNKINNEFTDYECIICYENNNEKTKLYTLESILNKKNILSDCSCNLYIHISCFDNWTNTSFSCPICRTKYKQITYNFIVLKGFILLIIIIIIILLSKIKN